MCGDSRLGVAIRIKPEILKICYPYFFEISSYRYDAVKLPHCGGMVGVKSWDSLGIEPGGLNLLVSLNATSVVVAN